MRQISHLQFDDGRTASPAKLNAGIYNTAGKTASCRFDIMSREPARIRHSRKDFFEIRGQKIKTASMPGGQPAVNGFAASA
ncbi:hypothetical protein CKA34_17715 [Rhizobium sp. 11515TR]|nr:hypothetical protein CKA34_17715 [Rhizobium sp. 11515TR]